jgi:hypothetical protein
MEGDVDAIGHSNLQLTKMIWLRLLVEDRLVDIPFGEIESVSCGMAGWFVLSSSLQ